MAKRRARWLARSWRGYAGRRRVFSRSSMRSSQPMSPLTTRWPWTRELPRSSWATRSRWKNPASEDGKIRRRRSSITRRGNRIQTALPQHSFDVVGHPPGQLPADERGRNQSRSVELLHESLQGEAFSELLLPLGKKLFD